MQCMVCDMATPWWEWVEKVSGERDQISIARELERLGVRIDASTLSNWKTGKTKPTSDKVVRFARAYRVSPVVGLIAAGILTESDVPNVVQVDRSLGERHVDELLENVRSRIPDDAASGLQADDISAIGQGFTTGDNRLEDRRKRL